MFTQAKGRSTLSPSREDGFSDYFSFSLLCFFYVILSAEELNSSFFFIALASNFPATDVRDERVFIVSIDALRGASECT